jgi:hypothetical protein
MELIARGFADINVSPTTSYRKSDATIGIAF